MVLVAAIVAVTGYWVKTAFTSTTVATATANTLSPHEIHLNYKGMESLPVHEIKDAN
jgi:hypothetical protein